MKRLVHILLDKHSNLKCKLLDNKLFVCYTSAVLKISFVVVVNINYILHKIKAFSSIEVFPTWVPYQISQAAQNKNPPNQILASSVMCKELS